MDKKLGLLWGKTDREKEGRWNPLLLHLIDVAASVEAILDREPASTRQRIAKCLDLPWDDALPWVLFIAACHDLGKACPGFQFKDGAPKHVREMELKVPVGVECDVHHAFVSQIALKEFLDEKEWPCDLATHVADSIGCHHGERCSSSRLENLEGRVRSLGDMTWHGARMEICHYLFDLFQPKVNPDKSKFTGPDFMLISGLVSFADWIGSNEDFFPFGVLEDTFDLSKWLSSSRKKAKLALDSVGWNNRKPLSKAHLSFKDVFGQSPRPLQEAIEQAVKEISKPSIILVEAPMGEGKTEAAFYAHLEIQRALGHRGLYIALPTKATGNAMFERTLKFLASLDSERSLDLQLVHGTTLLNKDFQEIRLASIHNAEDKDGGVFAAEWFTLKKRALLSEYGVGTIDQALLSILSVRHQFVRLWGLANRVVVFDEIHAYDAYTGTLLIELLRWLLSLNSSIILLSATLPPKFKRELAKIVKAPIVQDPAYPRLSIFQEDSLIQIPFNADPSRKSLIEIQGISSEIHEIKNEMDSMLINGGMGLVLVNTVDRAQKIYQLFDEGLPLESEGLVGKILADGTEVILFHARFPSDRRQVREEYVLSTFGVNSNRQGKKILIATQVAEQSLDLDFDCIITDLAPIDLILQRAGRLWRHRRISRPIAKPMILIAGLNGESPCGFDAPLWWSAVYKEDILLRTWLLLKNKPTLLLPDEIDELVKTVYEDNVLIPDFLKNRFEGAEANADGKTFAHQITARNAIIGYPDDDSWDDCNRSLKSDDETGSHPSLRAQTRLGEPSIVVIPIFPNESTVLTSVISMDKAKSLYVRSLTLSRKQVVCDLQAAGIPDNWKKSSLLRNCYPLILNEAGYWENNPCIQLNDELGLVYESKERK